MRERQDSDGGCARGFYTKQYNGSEYAIKRGVSHPYEDWLRSRVSAYGVGDKHCLEIGCGRGYLQDIVDDYTGVDLASSVASYHRKRFLVADSTDLPFSADEFDVVWTYAVLEHVSNPEIMLEEMRRVVKPGGLIFLHAAWHCASYQAEGLPVRRFRDLSPRLWAKKVLAWFDRRSPVRAIRIVSLRVFLLMRQLIRGNNAPFHFFKLDPNYEIFWMSDSDACCSMDQLEAWFWFKRQGDICCEPKSFMQAFFQTNGELVIQVDKGINVREST